MFSTPDRTGNNAQLFVAERLSNDHRAVTARSPGATSESLDVVAVDTSELEEDAAHLGAAGLLHQQSSSHPSPAIRIDQVPASKVSQGDRHRPRAPKLPTLERGTLYSAAHEAADPNYAALNAQRLAEEEAEWEEARRPDEDIQFTSFDEDEGAGHGTSDQGASVNVPSAVLSDTIAGPVSSSVANLQAAAQREISRRMREESTQQSRELERALHFDDAEDESQPSAAAMTAARRHGAAAAASTQRDSLDSDDSESGGTMEWDDEMVEIHIPAPPAPEGLGLDFEPNAPGKQRRAARTVAVATAGKPKFEKTR